METSSSLLFPPFRLDLRGEQLWRDTQDIALRPKTFAVLRYLAEHPGRVVTKDELLDAVWAGTVVGDTVLKSCIRELREALGDDAQAPHYIATVHRRGYRFLAPLTAMPHAVASARVEGSRSPSPAPSTQHSAPILVGRKGELEQLHRWLEKAVSGERQLVFVTGEPGIGKTTLVEAFLQHVTGQDLWVGRGQCIEQYGTGEAYMPILEALGRLCREPGEERLIALLHQYAPTWLVQMPTLLQAAELEALQRKVAGATRERMLREMVEAIDILTVEQPLVLWLEDLHWSDPSTPELLALLARRREPARLLVVGTYRPVDVIVREHPLKAVKQELQLHGQCQEVAVRLLNEAAVEEYLTVRFDASGGTHGRASLQPLAHTIHQRTEGNPLFMVNIVNELLAQGKVDSSAVEGSTPATIRQMIEQQFDRLSPEEQQVIEVASVAGMEFSAAAVAAGTDTPVTVIEERCAALARRGQFLRGDGQAEWPDGTIASHYIFLHALYQEVSYERVSAGRQAHLHQRIGKRAETAYGAQAGEIAAELAVHFERGRDYARAAKYHLLAGEAALQRYGHHEASTHFTQGLALLKTLPDTPEHVQQELTLQLALGAALLPIKGYTTPEVEKTVTRARALCQQLGEPPQLVPVLVRLWLFYLNRGELQTAHELAQQAMRLAQSVHDRSLLSEAHLTLGVTLLLLGELTSALTHVEQALALYDPQKSPHSAVNMADPRVVCLSGASHLLWYLGYPDQALKRSQEAMALAEGLSHPFSLAIALGTTAWVYSFRREGQLARERAEAVMTLSSEQEFPYWLAFGMVMRGWALTLQDQVEEGIVQMQQGLAAFRAMGVEVVRTDFLPMLAAPYAKVRRVEEGLSVLVEALGVMDKTGVRVGEAELYRLKGMLTLQSTASLRQVAGKSKTGQRTSAGPTTQHLISSPHAEAEAEACFHKAIEIARKQQAKSWELRAVMSLCRLWQGQGKKKEARRILAEIYGWFTEGFDTADLQEAKALLDVLAR